MKFKIVLSAGILLSTFAHGATRTIQFVGVAENDPTTAEVSNWSTQSVCTVVVVNSGVHKQRIEEMTFFRYIGNSSTSYTSLETQSQTKSSSYIASVMKSGATSQSNCAGQSIDQGGICVIRFMQDTLAWTGRVGWCSGRLVVSDVDASKPGSMVASGAIVLNQEAMVLGGMLSGAYYASGTHTQPIADDTWPSNMASRNTPSTSAGGTTSVNSDYDTGNMNYLCAKACRAYASAKGKTWSQDQCEEHCGMSCYDGDGTWCRNIVSATTSSVENYFKDTVVDAASASTTSVNEADTYQRTANPHFAGGMVYEMIVGPMVSICSGNMLYWQEGGIEFSHSDGVDTHAVYKSNSVYPGAPPERLMCSHRHMKQELFLRVGSSTPIMINGGLAF